MDKKLLIMTGGGTGGHIYPNLALIPDFKEAGFSVAYIGGEGDTAERRLAGASGLDYYGIPVIKLIRSMSLKAISNNLKIPLTLAKSVKETTQLLKELSPAAIFSKGGFVSLPVTIAAARLKIPVFAHESDYTLGLANKLAAMRGATVLKGNPLSKFDGIFTGMPLRRELFSISKQEARRKLKIPAMNKVLLIVGGSLGADAINRAVWLNLGRLTDKFTVIHITGKNKTDPAAACADIDKIRLFSSSGAYRQVEYADRIWEYLAAADVCVSRAGATAVAELAALNARALLIPLPKGVSRGDQLYNAELGKSYGAAVLYQDGALNERFAEAVESCLNNPPMKEIGNDANGKITAIISDSIRRGEICTDKKPSPNGSRSSSS